MLIGDGCVYMDNAMLDLKGTLGGSNTVAPSVINSCLANVSLVTALNLTSQFNFAEMIRFPDPLNTTKVDAIFEFDALAQMRSAAAALAPANYYSVDPAGNRGAGFSQQNDIDQYILAMNQVPSNVTGGPIFYNDSLVLSYHSLGTWYTTHYTVAADYNNITALESRAYDGLMLRAALIDANLRVRSGISGIDSSVADLKNRLKNVASIISNSSDPNSMRHTLDPLLGKVIAFINSAECNFVAVSFGNFKKTLCNTLENSLQFITLALFLIGLSCFGITWCSRWTSYRIQFVPRIAPAPFDEGAWMQANGQEQGVQMAVVDDGTAGRAEQQPGSPGYGTASGKAAYGDAVRVPPYQAALDAYSNNDGQTGGEDERPADGEAVASPSHYTVQSPDASGSAAAAAAVVTIASPSAAAAAETFPFGKCDSCESKGAMVKCVECDEAYCEDCDNTLHAIVANQTHDRTMLA